MIIYMIYLSLAYYLRDFVSNSILPSQKVLHDGRRPPRKKGWTPMF